MPKAVKGGPRFVLSYRIVLTDGDRKFKVEQPTLVTAVRQAKLLASLARSSVEVRTGNGKLICDVWPSGATDVTEYGTAFL